MNISTTHTFSLTEKGSILARKPLVTKMGVVQVFVATGKSNSSHILLLDKKTLEVAWDVSVPETINNIVESPDGTLIYSNMTLGTVTCIRQDNGSKIWTWENDEPVNIGSVSEVVNGKIVVGSIHSQAQEVWGIDVSDGTSIWRNRTAGHSYSPVVSGDRVFMSSKKTAQAYSLESGNSLWSSDDKESYQFVASIDSDERVYVGAHGHINIYAPKSGKTIGKIDYSEEPYAVSGKIHHENAVIFTDMLNGPDKHGNIRRYNISKKRFGANVDSEMAWSQSYEHGFTDGPLLIDGVVFAANTNKQLLALDLESGELIAEHKLKQAENAYLASDEGVVFVACGKHLQRLEIN